MSLATKSSSVAQTTQYWYLTESQGGYIIENVKSHKKLSVSTQNGALTCTLSDAEQVWTFENYVSPAGVVTFEKGDSNLFLKNLTGKAYEGEDIGVGSYEYTYDKCGFRLRYDESFKAYYILPIASCNGQFMALTAKNTTSTTGNTVEQRYLDGEDMDNTGSNDWDAEDARSGNQVIDHARQLFLMEWHLDGSYTLILDNQGGTGSNPVLVLTANSDNTVTLSPRNADLSNQKWNLSAYQYTSPQSNITDDYSKVEEYYKSLGFLDPYTNNNDLGITSDFGLRYSGEGTSHEGIDLSIEKNTQLYSPCSGKVAYIRSTNNSGSASGRYVIVETDYYEYGGTEENGGRKIYIIYMHLQETVSFTLGAEIAAGTLIGCSGRSGYGDDNYYPAHLHYGVFLAQGGLREIMGTNSNYQFWTRTHSSKTSIDPLLFFDVDEYTIRKDY